MCSFRGCLVRCTISKVIGSKCQRSSVQRSHISCLYASILQFLHKCVKRRQCTLIWQLYGIKNKAAIALQCESNVKLIAALLFICIDVWRLYGIKNKAAIALQCESHVKLIAALLFIPYSYLIWGESFQDESMYIHFQVFFFNTIKFKSSILWSWILSI